MQTKVNRETAKELFKLNPKALEMIAKCTDDFMFVSLMTAEQMKSDAQNRLFHGLLSCFWDSGCSSFATFDELRRYYKKMAGLIEYKFQNDLSEETKKTLWRAIKLLPLSKEEEKKVIELLRGKVEVEKSWGSVKKKDAQIAIDRLLNDMDASGVIVSKMGNKYQSILNGMGAIC